MEWEISIALALGVIVGIGLTLAFSHFRKPRSLLLLEAEHSKLRDDVMEHFVTTANLVNDMTDSYKAVFDHLNEGATKLVDGELLRERLPHDDTKVITLSRIGQPITQTDTEDGQQSSEKEEKSAPQQEVEDDLEPPRF